MVNSKTGRQLLSRSFFAMPEGFKATTLAWVALPSAAAWVFWSHEIAKASKAVPKISWGEWTAGGAAGCLAINAANLYNQAATNMMRGRSKFSAENFALVAGATGLSAVAGSVAFGGILKNGPAEIARGVLPRAIANLLRAAPVFSALAVMAQPHGVQMGDTVEGIAFVSSLALLPAATMFTEMAEMRQLFPRMTDRQIYKSILSRNPGFSSPLMLWADPLRTIPRSFRLTTPLICFLIASECGIIAPRRNGDY